MVVPKAVTFIVDLRGDGGILLWVGRRGHFQLIRDGICIVLNVVRRALRAWVSCVQVVSRSRML